MILLKIFFVWSSEELVQARDYTTSTALSGPYDKENIGIITNNLGWFKKFHEREIEQLRQKDFFSKKSPENREEVNDIIHRMFYRKAFAYNDDFITYSYQQNPNLFIEAFNKLITFLEEKPKRQSRTLNKLLFGLQKILEWDYAPSQISEQEVQPDNKKRKTNHEDQHA